MRDGEKVEEIKPGQPITVRSTSRSYQARSLIITAGPWTNRLLRPLGIELPLRVKGHWKPENWCPREDAWESDGLKLESRNCCLLVDERGLISSPQEPQFYNM